VTFGGFNNPNISFVNQKVWQYNGHTAVWTNITQDLNTAAGADVSVLSIVHEKGSNDGLYVSTNAGVFYTNNSFLSGNGAKWQLFNQGLPNVRIEAKLEINYHVNRIRAFTYGRGLWESNLFCPTNTDINYTSTVNPNSGVLSGFYEAEHNVSFNPVGSNIYNSGTVTVRAGNSIDLLTANNNTIIFTPTSTANIHLFIHGCDHPGNSFRKQDDNTNSGSNTSNTVELEKPITKAENVQFTYYPNPFADHLHIDFLLEKSTTVNVTVYNSFGQIVKTVAQGKYEAGEQNLFFDGSSLTPGVYFVKLDFGDKHYAKAVIKQ
jgi:hypothetical protein